MLPPRGYMFIGLNAIRVLSIVGLILVFSSSIFVITKDVKAVNAFQDLKQSGNSTEDIFVDCDYVMGSTVPNEPAGVFWAIVNRLLIIFEVITLLLSELSLFSKFFDRYFPVLGPSFGLGALGLFECLIGATILSQHVEMFPLVSAFFLFSVGCVNILLGLIFREKAKHKRSLMSWKEDIDKVKGITPFPSSMRPPFAPPRTFHLRGESGSVDRKYDPEFGMQNGDGDAPMVDEKFGYGVGYGFGTRGEKAAAYKGYLISKPLEALPRYSPPAAAAAGPPTIRVTRPPTPPVISTRPSPARVPSPLPHSEASLSPSPSPPLSPPLARASRFSEPSAYSQPSPSRYSHEMGDAPPVPPVPKDYLTWAPKFKSSTTAI